MHVDRCAVYICNELKGVSASVMWNLHLMSGTHCTGWGMLPHSLKHYATKTAFIWIHKSPLLNCAWARPMRGGVWSLLLDRHQSPRLMHVYTSIHFKVRETYMICIITSIIYVTTLYMQTCDALHISKRINKCALRHRTELSMAISTELMRFINHYSDVIWAPVTGEFPTERASDAENV